MKNMTLSALLLFSVLLAACSNDATLEVSEEVRFQVKATYDGEPLVLFREYSYEDSLQVLFQLYQFYLSDLRLVREDGSSHLLSEIELIRFENTQDELSAEAGIPLLFTGVPRGSYVKLRMGIGVDPELNQTTPSDYSPGHPLSDNYWSAAKGYIFSKIEGRADTLSGDGFDDGITFHTGSDELYTVLEFPIQLSVGEIQQEPLVLRSDLKRVLVRPGGDFLDFREYSVDHHVNPAVYEFIGQNLPQSFVVEK